MHCYVIADGGVRLYVEVEGTGTPVVLITGLASSMEWWRRAMPKLVGEGMHVAAHDLRGTARSDPAEDVGVPTQARDVVAIADHLGWAGFSVIGLSFGGMVVQELLCSTAAERIERAVLLTPGPSVHPPEYVATMRDPANSMVAAMLASAGQSRLEQLRSLEPHLFTDRFRANQPAFVDQWRSVMADADAAPDPSVRTAYSQASAVHDRRSSLGSIRTPVLSIIGSEDTFVWPSLQLADAGAIPGALAVQFTGARHGMVWEAADEWVRLAAAFLRGEIPGVNTCDQ